MCLGDRSPQRLRLNLPLPDEIHQAAISEDLNYTPFLALRSRPSLFLHQCFITSPVLAAPLPASGLASTLAASSSGRGEGWRSRATSSTLSIHLTGTISIWLLTFSGIS